MLKKFPSFKMGNSASLTKIVCTSLFSAFFLNACTPTYQQEEYKLDVLKIRLIELNKMMPKIEENKACLIRNHPDYEQVLQKIVKFTTCVLDYTAGGQCPRPFRKEAENFDTPFETLNVYLRDCGYNTPLSF